MTSRKIVAIGGGENWRLKNWERLPYETWPMDQEIIKLTGKQHPNFLLLAHSQPLERQEFYFTTMRDIYGEKYGCECKDLKSDKLTDAEYVKEIIEWADIIYEWWWDTLNMIKLWKETWFDEILRKAWKSGKVMCGVSAWANCRFNKCSSDSLKIMYWPDQPLIWMDCLWFVDWLFVPHADELGRQESVKDLLKEESNEIWLLLSNCAAIEIIDNKYKIIKSEPYDKTFKPYALKTYYINGELHETEIKNTYDYDLLDNLLKKD